MCATKGICLMKMSQITLTLKMVAKQWFVLGHAMPLSSTNRTESIGWCKEWVVVPTEHARTLLLGHMAEHCT